MKYNIIRHADGTATLRYIDEDGHATAKTYPSVEAAQKRIPADAKYAVDYDREPDRPRPNPVPK